MKRIFIILALLLISAISHGADRPSVSSARKQIGPLYAPPIEYKGSLYLLSSSGALYESDLDQRKVKELFRTKLRSVAGLVREGETLYFGDGMHEDKVSSFYAYDLESKKKKFVVSVKGHIEKQAVIAGELVIVGLGPGGIAAFHKNSGKVAWQVKSVDGKSLHVDSAPVLYGQHVIVGSIYSYKAILSFHAADGNLNWKYETGRSPKSDLTLTPTAVVSIASDGNLGDQNREIPSDLVALKPDTGELIFTQTLRGSNYFPQLAVDNEMFVALTTGDIISVNLAKGNITLIDQYPEPFVASTFMFEGKRCAMSSLGRLFCYEKGKLAFKRELGEINIGLISAAINGRVYIPSRAGYAVLSANPSKAAP